MDTIALEAPSAVPEVRHRASTALARWCCPQDRIDDAVLVTSEVVTNAVEHGAGRVLVRLLRRGWYVRIEVQDNSPRPPVPLAIGPAAERGRGLHIVASVASRWGSRRTKVGKVVWAEVAAGTDIGMDDLTADRGSGRS